MKQQPEAKQGSGAPELTQIPHEVFRAYDIRGIVEQQLTPEFAYHLGMALGSEIRAQGLSAIVVGYDGRLSSPSLHANACQGLTASGVDVFNIGMCSSPMLYFACFDLPATSGLMITGSHNPPDYNGMKILINQQTLLSSGIQDLKRRIIERDYSSGNGSYQTVAVKANYLQAIQARVKLNKPLKLVLDAGHGVAALVAKELFTALGCEVVPLHCTVDGTFPCHHPDPSIAENLADLSQAVVANSADIGLAFDGDADRLGVVDSDGKIIWPDRQMMVFAEYFLKQKPNDHIVFDVKCSKNLASYIANLGGKPVMWKTGHSLIKAKMHELDSVFSGEMSGHLFFGKPWFGFDDGVYAGAVLCQIFSEQQQTSADWFARLPDSCNTSEIKVNIAEADKFNFIEKLADNADFNGAELNLIDGLRIEYPSGWGLVRASNTTPCLTLRFEADDQTTLLQIQQLVKQAMLSVDANLEVPF